MRTISEVVIDLQGAIPASLEALESVCRRLRESLEPRLSRADLFAAELLFRELATNAVVHGCRSDAARSICYEIRLHPDRLVLAVEDDGDGFDWRSRMGRQADPESDCGRGLSIFRLYAAEVGFNETGNRVELTRPLARKGNEDGLSSRP